MTNHQDQQKQQSTRCLGCHIPTVPTFNATLLYVKVPAQNMIAAKRSSSWKIKVIQRICSSFQGYNRKLFSHLSNSYNFITYDLIIIGKLESAADREKDELFERPEDDAVTTSTSVFVAQPGSAASTQAAYCSASSSRLTAGDNTWLTWLCIAFGVLFVIMLLINIFLCSAMTCSCTKSEIIEKEPSIYDDYSIYESQYG